MFNLRKKLPPGPSIFSLLNEFPSDPAVFQQSLAAKYGGVCKIPGMFRHYLLSAPAHIERVLKTQAKNYLKTDLAYKSIATILGQGLLSNSDNNDWLSQRRHLQPLFHPHTLEQLAANTIASTLALCQRWETFAAKGKPFDLFHEMLMLVFTITDKTLFNGDFAAHGEQILRFSKLSNIHVASVALLCPWLPTWNNICYRKSRNKTDSIINEVIQRRRLATATATATARNDLLTVLINIKDETTQQSLPTQRVVDEIKTFLLTGSEATGAGLAWMWHCLLMHPESNQQLQQELNTVLQGKTLTAADLEKLTYPLMIAEESLRLHPPIWVTGRRAVEQDEIGGYIIPRNANVVISPYVMHRHPDYWDNPNAFNPQRFAEENKRKIPKYVYLPFGVGPRVCIGASHALLQMQLILSVISQYYDLELDKKRPLKPRYLVTLQPKNGVWVRIKKK